jgi:endonuclease/exonuclease/phosphatase family metal-dependent hydrolase
MMHTLVLSAIGGAVAVGRARALATVGLAFLMLLAGCRPGGAQKPTSAPPLPNPVRTPAPEVRVLVLNMHAGRDAAGADNLERVAALVRRTAADVVLLQEVDSLTRRSGGVDQLAELRRLTGYDGRFGNALDYQGGGYGIAVLSRWPVAASGLTRLPVAPPQVRASGDTEPRGALHVELRTPGGTLHVVDTHLDPSADDHWRRQEAAAVLALARRLAADGAPVLVGGDLNSTPESAVQVALREGGLVDLWAGCGGGDGFTYPVAAPVKRIDYLFAVGDVATCRSAAVLDDDASDHRGVLFTLTITPIR